MPTVDFAPALTRHVACPPQRVEAPTLRLALGAAFVVAFPPKPQDGPWKDDPTPWSVDLMWGLEAAQGRLFEAHGYGLPQRDAYHLIYRHALVVADDCTTLAMGSTTGGLWISDDADASWHCISRDLPPIAVLRWV